MGGSAIDAVLHGHGGPILRAPAGFVLLDHPHDVHRAAVVPARLGESVAPLDLLRRENPSRYIHLQLVDGDFIIRCPAEIALRGETRRRDPQELQAEEKEADGISPFHIPGGVLSHDVGADPASVPDFCRTFSAASRRISAKY